VPNAPVRDTLETMADPQTAELGIMQALPDSALRLMGLPLSFDGDRPPLRRPAPAPGEHNAEIKESED
jgi:crotonobetainyl-CoA:carnitine CoA-transferase CaiB-like acyl-CoA transferase